MRIMIAAAAVLAAALVACSGGGSGNPAGWTADNVRVCQHYRTQRAGIKAIAEPVLADAETFVVWVAADAAQATPGTPLARDLHALSAAQADLSAPDSAVHDTSARVLADCAALGVSF